MSVHYQQQWEFPSNSTAGKTYKVSLKDDGTYICNCWPFLRSKETPRTCNHIAEVIGGGGKLAKQRTFQDRASDMLHGWAEKGYRYITWVPEPGFSWHRHTIEQYRNSRDFADVHTFAVGAARYIVAKEKPETYQRAIDRFRLKMENTNFRTKEGQALKPALKKEFFELTQYILFNKTGIPNPNLDPIGGIHIKGFWGGQIHAISRRWKFLR